MILPDVLKENLDIVFCGTAAGNKSAELNEYYAGPGNSFYPTLALIGLTPRILKPAEFRELIYYKIGLTDLAKHHFGMDREIKKDQFDIKDFEQKILKYQPRLVCFNGKKAAMEYFNLKSTNQVFYGMQSITIGTTKLYVAPSTSSGAKRYWDKNLWLNLTNLIH